MKFASVSWFVDMEAQLWTASFSSYLLQTTSTFQSKIILQANVETERVLFLMFFNYNEIKFQYEDSNVGEFRSVGV